MSKHNTDNDALLQFGHSVVAPHLLSHLLTLDELALALDMFTMMQKDHTVALEENRPFDLELEDLG